MSFYVKETGEEREELELIDQGMQRAICYAVYDLGHQYNSHYDKWSHKVVVMWELPDFRIEIEKDGEKLDLPRAISKQYTASLGEKAYLRKDLVSWRGKAFTKEELEGFDLRNLLGVQCNLQIVHNQGKGQNSSKTYANINSVTPKMKDQEKLKAENPLAFFHIEESGAGTMPPEGTPKWIAERVMESKEYKEALETEAPAPSEVEEPSEDFDEDDNCPF